MPPKPGQHVHSEIDDLGRSPSGISQTLYEEIVHPNEEKSVLSDAPSRRPSYILGPQPSAWVDSTFVNWFVKFDEEFLRPKLIRNYSLANVMLKDQFDDAVSRTQTKANMDMKYLENASFADRDNSIVVRELGLS